MNEIATSFVRTLRLRGVTLRVRNNRLWLQPAHAYRVLTDDELLTLRHHRDEIKAIVQFGFVAPEPTHEPEAPAPELEPVSIPPPEPAVPEHIRRILDWHSPAEHARRTEEATDVMNQQLIRRRS
jgi:hypothetical protein